MAPVRSPAAPLVFPMGRVKARGRYKTRPRQRKPTILVTPHYQPYWGALRAPAWPLSQTPYEKSRTATCPLPLPAPPLKAGETLSAFRLAGQHAHSQTKVTETRLTPSCKSFLSSFCFGTFPRTVSKIPFMCAISINMRNPKLTPRDVKHTEVVVAYHMPSFSGEHSSVRCSTYRNPQCSAVKSSGAGRQLHVSNYPIAACPSQAYHPLTHPLYLCLPTFACFLSFVILIQSPIVVCVDSLAVHYFTSLTRCLCLWLIFWEPILVNGQSLDLHVGLVGGHSNGHTFPGTFTWVFNKWKSS